MTPMNATSSACRATTSRMKPEHEHDAHHERRLGGEGVVEVVVLGDRAADEHRRRQLVAQSEAMRSIASRDEGS